MQYLNVRWRHESATDPVLLYSELDELRYELRKVEVFADGTCGFASPSESSRSTELGTMPVPPDSDISSQSEFELLPTSRSEFETAWTAAHDAGTGSPRQDFGRTL